jgi:hypothetical protein
LVLAKIFLVLLLHGRWGWSFIIFFLGSWFLFWFRFLRFSGIVGSRFDLLLKFLCVLLDLFELLLFVLLLIVNSWFKGSGCSILFLVVNVVGFGKFLFSFSLGVSGLGSCISIILLFASITLLLVFVQSIPGHLLKSEFSGFINI